MKKSINLVKVLVVFLLLLCTSVCVVLGFSNQNVDSAYVFADSNLEVLGASVKLNQGTEDGKDKNGMRFGVTIDTETFEAISNGSGFASGYSVGAFISPTSSLPKGFNAKFTDEYVASGKTALKKFPIGYEMWSNLSGGQSKIAYIYMYNFPISRYDKDFTVISYIEHTYTQNGKTKTDYLFSEDGKYCMADVALKFYNTSTIQSSREAALVYLPTYSLNFGGTIVDVRYGEVITEEMVPSAGAHKNWGFDYGTPITSQITPVATDDYEYTSYVTGAGVSNSSWFKIDFGSEYAGKSVNIEFTISVDVVSLKYVSGLIFSKGLIGSTPDTSSSNCSYFTIDETTIRNCKNKTMTAYGVALNDSGSIYVGASKVAGSTTVSNPGDSTEFTIYVKNIKLVEVSSFEHIQQSIKHERYLVVPVDAPLGSKVSVSLDVMTPTFNNSYKTIYVGTSYGVKGYKSAFEFTSADAGVWKHIDTVATVVGYDQVGTTTATLDTSAYDSFIYFDMPSSSTEVYYKNLKINSVDSSVTSFVGEYKYDSGAKLSRYTVVACVPTTLAAGSNVHVNLDLNINDLASDLLVKGSASDLTLYSSSAQQNIFDVSKLGSWQNVEFDAEVVNLASLVSYATVDTSMCGNCIMIYAPASTTVNKNAAPEIPECYFRNAVITEREKVFDISAKIDNDASTCVALINADGYEIGDRVRVTLDIKATSDYANNPALITYNYGLTPEIAYAQNDGSVTDGTWHTISFDTTIADINSVSYNGAVIDLSSYGKVIPVQIPVTFNPSECLYKNVILEKISPEGEYTFIKSTDASVNSGYYKNFYTGIPTDIPVGTQVTVTVDLKVTYSWGCGIGTYLADGTYVDLKPLFKSAYPETQATMREEYERGWMTVTFNTEVVNAKTIIPAGGSIPGTIYNQYSGSGDCSGYGEKAVLILCWALSNNYPSYYRNANVSLATPITASNTKIVVSSGVYEDDDSPIYLAAKLLSKNLSEVCGDTFEIISDTKAKSTSYEIVLGNTKRLSTSGSYGYNEYHITSTSNTIYIYGSDLGIINGVYTWLESVGFKFLAVDQTIYPSATALKLRSGMNETVKEGAFTYKSIVSLNNFYGSATSASGVAGAETASRSSKPKMVYANDYIFIPTSATVGSDVEVTLSIKTTKYQDQYASTSVSSINTIYGDYAPSSATGILSYTDITNDWQTITFTGKAVNFSQVRIADENNASNLVTPTCSGNYVLVAVTNINKSYSITQYKFGETLATSISTYALASGITDPYNNVELRDSPKFGMGESYVGGASMRMHNLIGENPTYLTSTGGKTTMSPLTNGVTLTVDGIKQTNMEYIQWTYKNGSTITGYRREFVVNGQDVVKYYNTNMQEIASAPSGTAQDILAGPLVKETFGKDANGNWWLDQFPLTGSQAGANTTKLQLCMSNKVVRAMLKYQAKRHIAAAIEQANYLGVPAPSTLALVMEDNSNYCHCAECEKLYKTYGVTGAWLRMINDVADDIALTYPQIIVETYSYAFANPLPYTISQSDFNFVDDDYNNGTKYTVIPHDNVRVTICTSMCPIHECECACESLQEEMDRVEAWSKISKHVKIYYYNTSAQNCYAILPNFLPMLSHFKFFASLGCIDSVYIESNIVNLPEFDELRSYITAKILKNPNMSEAECITLIKDFLNGYYGSGAGYYLYQYIENALAFEKDYFDLDVNGNGIVDAHDRQGFSFGNRTTLKKGEMSPGGWNYNNPMLDITNSTVYTTLKECMDNAVSAASGNSLYASRVEKTSLHWRFMYSYYNKATDSTLYDLLVKYGCNHAVANSNINYSGSTNKSRPWNWTETAFSE